MREKLDTTFSVVDAAYVKERWRSGEAAALDKNQPTILRTAVAVLCYGKHRVGIHPALRRPPPYGLKIQPCFR